jgi:hypothetical protein
MGDERHVHCNLDYSNAGVRNARVRSIFEMTQPKTYDRNRVFTTVCIVVVQLNLAQPPCMAFAVVTKSVINDYKFTPG